jgi:Trypsin-like peptidase domain
VVDVHTPASGGGRSAEGSEDEADGVGPRAGGMSARTGVLVIGRPDGRRVTLPTPDRRLERAARDAAAELVDGERNRWVCAVTSDGRESWPLPPPEVREQRTQEAGGGPDGGRAPADAGRDIERSRARSPKRAGIGDMQPLFMGSQEGDVPGPVLAAAERVEKLHNLPAMCMGSAVPIARDPAEPNHTQVLTADHCVDGWSNFVTVGGAPGVTIHHDPQDDLALLDVAELMEPLPLRTTPVQPGEVTYTIGYPGQLGGLVPREQTITPGRVLSYGPEYIETDAVVAGGTSGGAVVDTQGRIVGLLVEGNDRSSGGPSAACIQQSLGMHEPAAPGQGPQHHDVTPRKAGVLDLGPSLAQGTNAVTHVGSTSAFSQAYWDVVEYMTPNVHDTAYDFALRATQDGHYDSANVAWQPHTYAHPEPPPPRPGGQRGVSPGGVRTELQPAPTARSVGFGFGVGVGEFFGPIGDFFVTPFVSLWQGLGFGGPRVIERAPAVQEIPSAHSQDGWRAFEQRPFGMGWEEVPVEVVSPREAVERYPHLRDVLSVDDERER